MGFGLIFVPLIDYDETKTLLNSQPHLCAIGADAGHTEQVRAGVFPVRLTSEDWVSGDIVWLLDVIANDRNQATRVLASFKQLSGDRPVKIHPIVARVVDRKILEASKGQPADASIIGTETSLKPEQKS